MFSRIKKQFNKTSKTKNNRTNNSRIKTSSDLKRQKF